MDMSEFDGLNFRPVSPVANNGENLIDNNGHDNDVDQILDLSTDILSANGHRSDDDDGVPVPIIAFQENRMTSPKQEVSTAGTTIHDISKLLSQN